MRIRGGPATVTGPASAGPGARASAPSRATATGAGVLSRSRAWTPARGERGPPRCGRTRSPPSSAWTTWRWPWPDRRVPGGRRRAGARREGHREVDDGAGAGRAAARRSTSSTGAGSPATRPRPIPACPDGPHPPARAARTRPARLVELPVGATEDRVLGSLHLERALREGVTAYEPGLLAAAHRGLLYVDEVNLLHDHLVDVLLDAAAMGRAHGRARGRVGRARRPVRAGRHDEPGGGRAAPAAAGPVRPDRGGRRPAGTRPPGRGGPPPAGLRGRPGRASPPATQDAEAELADADRRGPASCCRRCVLGDAALLRIAEVCAAFEVDGMRADLVTARAAIAHAAWHGRTDGDRAEDIRAAARLALPHRRRRNPFDAPGLDERAAGARRSTTAARRRAGPGRRRPGTAGRSAPADERPRRPPGRRPADPTAGTAGPATAGPAGRRPARTPAPTGAAPASRTAPGC